MVEYRPQLADLNLPPVNNWLPSAPLPSQPQSSTVISRPRDTKAQLPGEACKQYFARQQRRNEARMKTESAQDKQTRANQERASAGRQCPGHKGLAVYYWEPDSNGFQVRTLQTRRQVEDVWSQYSGPQKVFDSFENEWDCCTLFGDDSGTNNDGDIFPSAAPISTASNGIPRNATASTSSLPPLHQESTPIDLDTLFLPDPPISTATNGTPSPTSREESTSMDVDAPSHPAFNVIASTSTLPPPDKESTSPTPSYRNHCPHLTPSDEDRHHRVTQDDGPFGHRRNPDGDNPE